MSTEKKRIALIGGAGFIGHNLASKLKAEGHEVYVIDSMFVNNMLSFYHIYNTSPNKEMYVNFIMERMKILNDAKIPVYIQDARDYPAMCKILLKEIKPHVVVLLAAVSHADRSNKDPYSTFDHSLRTLENALDATKDTIEHFIYFSSSMVYGNFDNDMVTEETVCNPLGIYGALKIAGERIVMAYNQVFGLPYTIIRPSALYGQRCVSRRVLQIFLENSLKNMPIVLKGGGSDRLDFTYIDDLVHGVQCVINNKASINQTFNLTYGQSRSMKEVIDIMHEYIPNLNVKYEDQDRLVPKRGTLCIDKAKTTIGYNPQYPLEKGLYEYLKWYKTIL